MIFMNQPVQKLKDYSLKELAPSEEEVAGKKGTIHRLQLLHKGNPIAQIKYEMEGRGLKIWNRNVGKSPEERREINRLFATVLENKDKRTLGDELLFQAIRKRKPLAIITPHQTSSSKLSWSRMNQAYGIKLGEPLPRKIPKPLIKRRK